MSLYDILAYNALLAEQPVAISPDSLTSLGTQLASAGVTPASVAWASPSVAIYIPFYVKVPSTFVRAGWHNGSAVSGNVGLGIYSAAPSTGLPQTQLVSVTASHAVANSVQNVDITDTTLSPGKYFMALVLDNATGTVVGWTVASSRPRLWGCFQESGAYPLPATATPATATTTVIPTMTISRTTAF